MGGEHHRNGNAIMKANGTHMPHKNAQQIQVLPLGQDYVAAGWSIMQAMNDKGEVCAVLALAAGKMSPIAGLQLGVFPVHELGAIRVDRIKELVDKAMAPKTVEEDKPA